MMTFRMLTLTILFFSALSFGWAQSGDLVVFTKDGVGLNVALDSKFQNKKATSNLKITNIPEGDYWITLLFNDNRKAVKSNIRVLAGKENSFVVDKDGDSWKLKSYSAVSLSQVGQASGSQIRVNFSKEGVTVDGMNDATDLSKNEVEQNPTYTRVHGTLDELKEEAEKKRRGQFSGSTPVAEQEVATATPQLEEGTTITKRYIKTDNADGTVSIVEEATTTIKEVVTRNGQQQMRTKRSVAMTPTDFTCLPMEGTSFKAMLTRVQGLPKADRLTAVREEMKDACLTPAQIKSIGNLFDNKEELNLFAIAAQPVSADPNNFPYEVDAVAMEEEPVEEPVYIAEVVEEEVEEPVAVVEKPEPVAKTKAELRAELKAAKARERNERKAAKLEAKIARKKARAEAKAARAKK